MQHTSLSSQRVKCRYGRPLSTWPTETSMMRSFMMEHCLGMSANMLRSQGSQGTSIQHCTSRFKSLSWPLTCSARNLDRTKGTNAGRGNTYKLPETPKDGWRHSTPRPPEVVEFPWCNNADTEWYGRIPADPPLVDPKAKSSLSHLREKMPL